MATVGVQWSLPLSLPLQKEPLVPSQGEGVTNIQVMQFTCLGAQACTYIHTLVGRSTITSFADFVACVCALLRNEAAFGGSTMEITASSYNMHG